MRHALLRHALAASLSTFGPRSRALMSAAPAMITPRERFLFDLNGFLVVRGVFTPEEVAAANAAIDKHAASLQPRAEAGLRNAKSGTPLSATGPRIDMGGMLWWPESEAALFRDALVHPKLVPYYTELMGEGYRLDHRTPTGERTRRNLHTPLASCSRPKVRYPWFEQSRCSWCKTATARASRCTAAPSPTMARRTAPLAPSCSTASRTGRCGRACSPSRCR